jgi:phosphatidylinositol alpha-1,6-mannosyltransferase
MTKEKRICMGTESLIPGNGGICYVARLMAKILNENQGKIYDFSRTIVLSDKNFTYNYDCEIKKVNRSRLKFVYEIHKSAINCSHFIYDSLGMARAHALYPKIKKPFMTGLYGIELWEDARKDRISWAKRANILFAISEYTLNRVESIHGRFNQAKICWLGTLEDSAIGNASSEEKVPTVTILSRLDELGGYKGHKELISCWHKVVSKIPNARLLIAGDGPGRKYLQEMAGRSSVYKNIEFRGFIPDYKIDKMWNETTCFAMPSRGEGFGIVYIEAMRNGVPVIASVHDAGAEINIDGVTGYNVNLDIKDELPEKIIDILNNKDLTKKMGENGKLRWEQNFSFSKFKERFIPIFYKFIND